VPHVRKVILIMLILQLMTWWVTFLLVL